MRIQLFAISLVFCIIYKILILANFEKMHKKFQESYTSDIETNFEEVIQFCEYTKCSNPKINNSISIGLNWYRTLREHGLKEVFPNIINTLRMYLCLIISNCTGERSFSTLKRIKSYLRLKMAN